tara:strand:- start:681 stop:833 length:153 start_codon:yes stop_codon:yes gene_type:complete
MTNLKSILFAILTIIAALAGILLLPVVALIIGVGILFVFYRVLFADPRQY